MEKENKPKGYKVSIEIDNSKFPTKSGTTGSIVEPEEIPKIQSEQKIERLPIPQTEKFEEIPKVKLEQKIEETPDHQIEKSEQIPKGKSEQKIDSTPIQNPQIYSPPKLETTKTLNSNGYPHSNIMDGYSKLSPRYKLIYASNPLAASITKRQVYKIIFNPVTSFWLKKVILFE